MKKSLGAKTWAAPAPVWVVGTFGENGKPNFMTAAWGGICCSKPPCIYVSLRKATYTYNSIVANGTYTVSVPGEEYWKETDYMGIVSGYNTDKIEETGLTPVTGELVYAPYIKEFPLILECKVIKTIEIGRHTQFIGEILDVKADEEILVNGKPDTQKIKPLLFGPADRGYHSVGPRIANAFTQRDIKNSD
jgi:flavin reductase (DIM6/NTAB) family NADH-FMN oxidoreductase RutF